MSIIRILSEDVSNRIAAGEVIERPASVVKELIENALDAGADSISVSIEQAGKKLIAVTDNGGGMDADDCLLCFEPHATSKITSIEDMNKITTMGFRGEALPSIASVSRLRLRTRPRGKMEGNEVIIEGGKFIKSSPAGCAPGTEMTVRDLFFNTPARRKFLCADKTEEKHIIDTFSQIELAHPAISFELISDGVKVISSPGDKDLLPRIQTVFGKTMKDNLLPLHFEKAGITVSGFIARHGFTKQSRKEQRTYINNRPVESPAIYRGLKNGYESLVMKGCFPPVILFIFMPPERVDFNVHPAKREVRFREAGLVTNVITDAVREQLRQAAFPHVAIPGELSFNTILSGASVNYYPAEKEQQVLPEFRIQNPPSFDKQPEFMPEITPEINIETAVSTPDREATPFNSNSDNSSRNNETSASDAAQNSQFDILAFLDDTYILAAAASGLVIIDQHAAHERILFEQLMNNSNAPEISSQKLLLPITLELSRSETQFLRKNTEPFQELGFEIEPFGHNTIIIHAVPASFPTADASELFAELLAGILEEEKINGRTNKADIAKIACSRAVKAHDRLTMAEAKGLIEQMRQCQLPYSCPHGRPTIISISYKELEKRFGRK